MVIILNMENGELISKQDSADIAQRNECAVWSCPPLPHYPSPEGKLYVMPALMEHDFSMPS